MKKISLLSVLVILNLSLLLAAQSATPIKIKNEINNNSIATNEDKAVDVNYGPPASTEDNPEKQNSSSITVAPNPATDHIDVMLGSNTSSLKELALFDITGKLIRKIYSSQTGQEKNKLTINRDNLPGGVYFLVVKTTSEEHCRKIIFS